MILKVKLMNSNKFAEVEMDKYRTLYVFAYSEKKQFSTKTSDIFVI